ncbi:hypothetical protein RUM43_014733 [Polyplax serrata]|uniref:C2H2-type domain-containing protein n=1 Tax=Polyplax serrata TaxID=468196 RepID=A0AAN8NIR5_POLSC
MILLYFESKLYIVSFGENSDLDQDESGGPLHHSLFAQVQQDMYADLYGKYDSVSNGRDAFSLKRRGRPRKYVGSGKPIGRPRKFRPVIGDPIKFLQAASLSGLFKVNDENAQISGLSSFLNPNFRSSEKALPEVKSEPVEPQPVITTTETATEQPGLEKSDPKNCFACHFCGKSYKKKKHYNRHVNFECINTEPRFLCTMCSYKARRKEHLIRHLRSHIGDMMNSSDYGLLSSFKDDGKNHSTGGHGVTGNGESSDLTVSTPGLSVGNHNGQVYATPPPFGFVTL